MIVDSHDESGPLGRLTFNVSSRSGVDPWRVDLASMKGLGKCTCPDFAMNKMQEIKRMKALGEFTVAFIREDGPGVDRLRCAHIIAARRKFDRDCGNRVIDHIRKTIPDHDDDEDY